MMETLGQFMVYIPVFTFLGFCFCFTVFVVVSDTVQAFFYLIHLGSQYIENRYVRNWSTGFVYYFYYNKYILLRI